MTTSRHRRHRFIAPLIAAFVAAGALATAPVAAANSNQAGCRDSGGARMCSKQGHASLHSKPTSRAHSGALLGRAWLPGYGYGHLPPMIALD